MPVPYNSRTFPVAAVTYFAYFAPVAGVLGRILLVIYTAGMKKQNIKNKKKRLCKSRKVIMAVVALLVALTAFAQKELGISMNAGQAVAALGVIGTYLFGEFKSDLARLRISIFQGQKWKDPAFWVTLAASQLPVINNIFKLDLPVEAINSLLAFGIGISFKKRVSRLREVE